MKKKPSKPTPALKKNGQSQIRLAVDIGGTFTDIAIERGEERITAKVLTTQSSPDVGVLEGVSLALEKAQLKPSDIDLFIHGTTLATNALIERKGAKTALITTEGFRDVIEIGRESRFDQYDINLTKPDPLVPRDRRFTVSERIAANGDVLIPINIDNIHEIADRLRASSVESVAIAFLHSYTNPSHERQFAKKLLELIPTLWTSLSAEVSGEIREYERFTTTCANAYVQPIMASYLKRLEDKIQLFGLHCPLLLITSSGGLTTLESACKYPIRLVESGPAGGAMLASWVAKQCNLKSLLSFDMGGTTAKICLIDDFTPTKSRTFEVARTKRFMKGSGMPIRIPVVEMVEIGAGGGSIASIDSLGRLRVGPESATSAPGPACFGLGGKYATVTDADLALGKIDAEAFAAGRMKLDIDAAIGVISKTIAGPLGLTPENGAFGICEIVEENMANASRVHAIERGKDITKRAMLAFGGAAPLHASRLAEKLGITTVIVPTNAGVGSAVGFLRAPISYEVVRSQVVKTRAFDAAKTEALFQEMQSEGIGIVTPAAGGRKLTIKRTAFARYAGQGHELEIQLPSRKLRTNDGRLISETFNRDYKKLFGRTISHAEVEVLSWSVVVTGDADSSFKKLKNSKKEDHRAKPRQIRLVHDAATGKAIATKIFWRPDLRPGASINGPAIVAEEETSTVISSRFRAVVNSLGYLVLMQR